MSIKNKNIWFWAFMILLVVNIAAISTMIYTVNKIHSDASLYENAGNERGFIHPKRGHSHFDMEKRIQKRMGYSDEQMAVMKKLRHEHLQKLRVEKTALRKVQRALFEELASENPDSNKIESLKNKMSLIQGHIIDESIDFYKKVKQNSTPEQIKKMNRFFMHHLFRGEHGKQSKTK